ncbi:DUF4065 domain-containing protein [Clostridium botulinum]|uniref:Panacea domain-containing protein n=1 Tax=Clostridium botulinum TaxID=1491 RepID=UPI000A1725F9|nr:type II toxin-antitoxin system antitoxin SocA domain-containing protein [Clostridium botulinum]NFM45170.1 DUF4065 domain-containing protein [Clostridium botulinum]
MGKIIELFYKVMGDEKMINIFDVANYFIYRSVNDNECICNEKLTHLKLQKLCFYAQAWSLVWNNKELFNGEFQAWVHGPVNVDLYRRYSHKSAEPIEELMNTFNLNLFDEKERYVLNMIWENYGQYTAKILERMTHQEEPWKATRGDLPASARSEKVICNESIKRYYSQFS